MFAVRVLVAIDKSQTELVHIILQSDIDSSPLTCIWRLPLCQWLNCPQLANLYHFHNEKKFYVIIVLGSVEVTLPTCFRFCDCCVFVGGYCAWKNLFGLLPARLSCGDEALTYKKNPFFGFLQWNIHVTLGFWASITGSFLMLLI